MSVDTIYPIGLDSITRQQRVAASLFSDKQSANTGFTLGSVVFITTSGLLAQDNATFFWDNTNKRLVIGGNSVAAGKLHLIGAADAIQLRLVGHSTQTNPVFQILDSAGVRQVSLGGDSANYNIRSMSQVTTATRGITTEQYNAGAQGAIIWFIKGRGTSASPTSVATNDYNSANIFANYDSGNVLRFNGSWGQRITGAVGSNSIVNEIYFAANAANNADAYGGSGNLGIRISSDIPCRVGFGHGTNTTALVYRGEWGCNGATTAINIGAQRQTAAATGGAGFIVNGGGAVSGGTDKAGGDLTLASGISTGSGSSSVIIQAVTAGASATTDRTPATVATFAGAAITAAVDIKLGTAGNGLYVKEGTNATMGVATLAAGTVVVNTTKVTANSRIFLTTQGGTLTNVGATYISARTAGTSFTITSLNILDASDVAWLIVEPT